MRAKPVLARAAFCLAIGMGATTALAQNATTRVRGTVESLGGDALTVRTAEGESIKIRLAPDWQVSGVAKATLADIKPGAFIGVGARPQPDGTLNAVQVSIFPEASRGRGEGHRGWSVMPQATMTNATVADEVKAVDGAMLKLTYKGGEQRVAIKPDTVILKPAKAEKADLKAGAVVTVTAARQPDGSLSATRVTVAKGGARPF
jgi:hypothetical protein